VHLYISLSMFFFISHFICNGFFMGLYQDYGYQICG
jgi:hypothetical protein